MDNSDRVELAGLGARIRDMLTDIDRLTAATETEIDALRDDLDSKTLKPLRREGIELRIIVYSKVMEYFQISQDSSARAFAAIQNEDMLEALKNGIVAFDSARQATGLAWALPALRGIKSVRTGKKAAHQTNNTRFEQAKKFSIDVASKNWAEDKYYKLTPMCNYIQDAISKDPSGVGLNQAPGIEQIKGWIRAEAPPEATLPGRPKAK